MPDHPNQPQEYDAVLGGQTPIPEGSAILGGLEGVKLRLASALEEQRIAALSEALKYDEVGLDLVIGALQDESVQVEKTAYFLLRQRTESRVKQVLKKYNPWQFLTCLRTIQLSVDYTKLYADYIKFVGFSLDEKTLVCVSEECWKNRTDIQFCVAHYNLSTGKLLRTFRSFEHRIGSAAVSLDGQTLVIGSVEGILKIYHLPTEKLLRTIKGHSKCVESVAISPDGQTLVSGGYDKTLKIWRLETGSLIRTIELNSEEVFAVAISPDGKRIFSVDLGVNEYDSLKIWHLETGKLIRTLDVDVALSTTVAISPDGQTVVNGTWLNTIKIWHLQTEELLKTIEGNSVAAIFSVAISPDGKTIISGSEDSTIKIWGMS